MAFDDVPLEDAGRDYYAKQFGDRVRNIRKYGTAPPSRNSNGRGSGWAVAAVVFAVLVVIRVIITVMAAGGDSGSRNYDDAIQMETQPWQMQQPKALLSNRMSWPHLTPVIVDPDRLPPLNAPDEPERPSKDD